MQKGDNKGKANKAATAFPAYDAQRGQGPPKGGGKSGWKDGRDVDLDITEAGGLTQAIQTSLNGTRKAEQRVSSLSAALSRREQLWAMYEKDMAAAYKKEHARFLRDMAKIREDLQKATVAQADARKELMQVFHTGGTVQEPEPDVDVVGMMRAWRAHPAGDDADSILQRAARAMGAGPTNMQLEPELEEPWWPTAPNFGGPPPGLESRGDAVTAWPTKQAVHVEPTGSDYTAPAARDPYMTSPSAARGPTPGTSPIKPFQGPGWLPGVSQDEAPGPCTRFGRSSTQQQSEALWLPLAIVFLRVQQRHSKQMPRPVLLWMEQVGKRTWRVPEVWARQKPPSCPMRRYKPEWPPLWRQ